MFLTTQYTASRQAWWASTRPMRPARKKAATIRRGLNTATLHCKKGQAGVKGRIMHMPLEAAVGQPLLPLTALLLAPAATGRAQPSQAFMARQASLSTKRLRQPADPAPHQGTAQAGTVLALKG